VLDLRSYLNSVLDAVYRPGRPVSVVHDITALQQALGERSRYPIIHIEAPLLADGGKAGMSVVTNLNASRELTARAVGIDDHRYAAAAYAGRTGSGIEPVVVSPSEAPVREVVAKGKDVDLTALPALVQHDLDPGPYLTAAHATTRDPDSGIDNTAIQRCWIKGRRRMSHYAYAASHNARNIAKYWARGEPCPVAYWIGHHPAILLGAQAKLDYPQSHWSAAGGLAGEPVRLVPSVTHGEAILVPADAEIVIEGWLPADRLEADGPFGEYTGYMGPQVPAPVCEVTCITRRRKAIYHDYAAHLADALVPDNFGHEGRLHGLAGSVAPSLRTLYVPVSGRRFHCYLQFEKPGPGEVRDALMAALSYRRLKAAFAFDADIDIFDPEEVNWAMATRVQWDRDTFTVPGLSVSMLDPSLPAGARTAARLGVDATLPPPASADAPPPTPPRARVPEAALARTRETLRGVDDTRWPRA
jgi:UbiD family decarboxylase